MKKAVTILIVTIMLNLFTSIAYAGPEELPRPDSTEPSIMAVEPNSMAIEA